MSKKYEEVFCKHCIHWDKVKKYMDDPSETIREPKPCNMCYPHAIDEGRPYICRRKYTPIEEKK
jgi:hypothetical protein